MPSGPTDTIEKYLSYLNSRLMPMAVKLIVILLFWMIVGMAGATKLVA